MVSGVTSSGRLATVARVVEFADEFKDWWDELDAISRPRSGCGSIRSRVGDPTWAGSRSIGSADHNKKGLRASQGGALRVLFAFDPRRQAILLLGGDKSGQWAEWYEWAIPAADDLCDEYLNELREEGLIE